MLLEGYSFEHRPYRRALVTTGSVMIIDLSIIHVQVYPCTQKKKISQERTRLTSPEFWAAATSKS